MGDTVKPDPASGLLPLVIGVVGRARSCDNQTAIAKRLNNVLQTEVTLRYPHTPLILISSVTDRVNRAILDSAIESGIELIVPLPEPTSSFDSEHIEWIERNAVRWFTVPALSSFGDEHADGDVTRRSQRALTEAYIARYSDILIALQHDDEDLSDHQVNIAHIIEFKLNGRLDQDAASGNNLEARLEKMTEPFWLRRNALYPPDTGPVYQIFISTEAVAEPKLLLPEEFDGDHQLGRSFYSRMQLHVEKMNVHALAVSGDPTQAKYVEESREWLLKDDEARALSRGLQEMRRCYHNADCLAMHFQSRTARTLRNLCILAFLAAGSFIAYAHLLVHEAAPWPLALYFLAVAVAFRYYVNAQRLDYQNKYQDYRAIAEGLRVQFFWRLAGLDSSAAEYYLLKQTSELDWIRNVIRACALRTEPASKENMPLVLERWIKNQERFFSEKAPANRKELIIYRYIGEGFLLISLLLAIYVLMEFLYSELVRGFAETISESSEVFSQIFALVIAIVLLFFLFQLIRQISEQYKSVREEVVTEDSSALLSVSNGGAESPIDALRTQLEGLTHKPLNNLFIGIAGGLLLAGLVFAVPHALPFWSTMRLKIDEAELLIAAIGMTAVVGGLLHYYAEKRAFSEQAKQYARMAIIFKNASVRLSGFRYPIDYQKAASLIKELGIEALAENGDWVLLHRERPLEPVRSMEA